MYARRRCKSLDALQKHFRELHQREHRKRTNKHAPRKGVKKYLASEKSARYRWAGSCAGAAPGSAGADCKPNSCCGVQLPLGCSESAR